MPEDSSVPKQQGDEVPKEPPPQQQQGESETKQGEKPRPTPFSDWASI